MTNEHTFDAFRKRQTDPAAGFCPRCRTGQTAGSVGVQIRQRYAGKQKGDKTLGSMTRALCETCTIQVYEELTGLYADLLRGK